MSRRIVGVVAIAVVMSSLPLYAKRRAVAPRLPSVIETSPYLVEALSTAEWLTTLERPAPSGGLSWARAVGQGSGGVGMEAGAAGIGSFFLRLHQTTRDTRWLTKAEGAGQYIAAEFRAGRFYSHDWLAGGSGAGDFLLELHAATKKQEYVEAAHLLADFLIRTAIVDGDGIYWKHSPQNPNTYTGLAHGATGAGMFLVRLYNATGDSRYLDAAERVVRWLTKHTLSLQSNDARAITWKRLTTDTYGYNGWCGGSMGIALFLDELHRATGNGEYLELWSATAEGLWFGAARPRESPLQIGWLHAPTPGETTPNLATAYCHGTSSNAIVLAAAATRASGARYAEAPAAAGRWLDRVKIPASTGGSLWQHFVGSRYRETGLLTGTASVGHGSLKLYALTQDPAHLARATEAAQYLLGVADHPQPGQTRWLNRFDDSGQTPEYRAGWYSGAAGIGLFLVELHDSLNGRFVSSRFSALNP